MTTATELINKIEFDRLNDLVIAQKAEILNYKNSQICDSKGRKELNNFASTRVKEIPANEYPVSKRKLKIWLWGDYRPTFKIDSYLDTKVVDYDRAVKWILAWTPYQH